MATMTKTPESFWTAMSAKYAAQPIGNPANYEATLARTQSYLRAEDAVLEIGAGTSSTALRLAPIVARYVSSDYSAGMTEIGRQKAFDAAIPGLEVVQAAPGDATLGAAPFDTVLAFNLLHLLPNLDDQLRVISGHLRTGGLFISKTPCLGRRFGPIGLFVGVMRLFGRAPYVGFFRSAELDARVRAAGFELIETGDYGGRVGSRYLVARKL